MSGRPGPTRHTAAPARAVSEGPQVVDGVDVDAVTTAVLACPSVSGMLAGAFGGVITLLPGRRVPGVRVHEGLVTIEVRSRWGVTASTLHHEVATAVAGLVGVHPVHLIVGDIDDPPSADEHSTPSPRPDAAPSALVTSPPTPLQGEPR